MTSTIQRTELRTYYYTPVHCPFCGTRVMGADPQDETRITACPHTLFIAHDTAIEYRSDRFDENLIVQVEPYFSLRKPLPSSTDAIQQS